MVEVVVLEEELLDKVVLMVVMEVILIRHLKMVLIHGLILLFLLIVEVMEKEEYLQ